MRRPTAIVLSLLVVLVAAGCGGDGGATAKQDYSHQLAEATSSLQKAFAQLGRSAGSDSASAASRRLRQGATALQAAADRFARITPPADDAAAHRKLVDGLRRLATTFRQGAAAAQHNDAAALAKALRGIASSAGAREISQAERELARHGVTVTTASG